MGKLMALTPEQKALIPVVRAEWIAHGLSCEPADRPTAEAGVRLAYEAAGLDPPGVIVWLDSPMAGAVAAAMWPTWYPNGVGGQVGGQVHGQVRDQVRDQVHGQVDLSRWYRYVAGNLWSGYYGYFDFFRRIGITGMEPIEGQTLVARSAGWWWPMKDACIIVDRPCGRIHGEQVAAAGWGSHRLHREDGPAIQWRDGWAIWCWHGTRVPQWVVENPTPDTIRAETNTEIRRCAIESYGWDRWLDGLHLTPVSVQPDPGNPGHELALYDLPASEQMYGEPVRLLVMDNASLDRDGTRRRYAETVPVTVGSAVAASAWQFSVDENVYAGLQRAT